MVAKNFSLILILGIFICSIASAQKRSDKIRRYWTPSRVLTSTPSSSYLSRSDTLALQRVIQSQDQRIEKDPYLLQAVFHSSSEVSRAAIVALGRVGDPYGVETLARVLNGKNGENKKLAAFSLGLIGDDLSLRLLSQNIVMEKNPDFRDTYYRALGYSRQLSVLSILARALKTETAPSTLKNICEGLGILLSGDSSTWIIPEEVLQKLSDLSESPSPTGQSAAFALSQYKGDPKKLPLNRILTSLSKNSSTYGKVLLVRTLGKIEGPQITTSFLAILVGNNPSSIKIEVMKSLRGKNITDLMLTPFKKALSSNESHLIVATLETLKESPEQFKSLTETVFSLFKNSNSSWVKGASLQTLSRLDPGTARNQIKDILSAPNSPLLSPALTSLVALKQPEDLSLLLPFLKMGNPKIISESLESLSKLSPNQITEDLRNSLKQLVLQKDPGLIALIAELAKQNRWTDFSKPLSEVFSSLSAEDATESRSAVVSALGVIGSEETLEVLTSALKDPSKQVVTEAIESIRTISGKEVAHKVPLNNKIMSSMPPFAEWNGSTKKKVTLGTTKGNIEIRFFDDTPLTAFRFLELVQKKFYHGKIFHRTVTNFVVQGGDPRGDGFGGPGYLIRDEVSPRNHERGTLGIATSGKDTGGCQFFLNLAPNYHLNGRYTTFAEVTSGLEVMDRLEVGDKIIFTRVQ